MTLVKVCGMTRPEDVAQAVEAGADMVGFIIVPWSPRAVDVQTAHGLRRLVPRGVEAVGVLVDETVGGAARILEEAELDRVQVYGAHAAEIRELLGERAIVACRRPADEPPAGDPLLLDRAFGDEPDADDLDAHWREAAALGAAGRRVLLAGALDPANVARAVEAARPWAVDVARGVEREPGVKDHSKVTAFIGAVREGTTA
jgi:phosphoribosylanthranilate isomerase